MDRRSADGSVLKSSPEDVPQSTNGSQTPSRTARGESTFGNDEELVKELPPSWTLAKFQEQVKGMIKEYFLGCVLEEAVARIKDLLASCPGEADELVVVAIRAALDRDEKSQEAMVELICRLRKTSVLEPSAFVRSYEKLFCTWEDIRIDAPKAPEALLGMLLGCFAGGVCEHTLLTKIPENLLAAGLASKDPRLLPESKQLLKVQTELKEFKTQSSRCLEEYFVSLHTDEVANRLGELNKSSLHHEFVKKAIIASFSKPNVVPAREAVIALLQDLTSSGTLSKDDLQWGVTRLLGQLDDLELDCPRVGDLTVELLISMLADDLVGAPFLRRCRLLRIGGPSGLQVLDSTQRRSPEHFKKHLSTLQFKKEIQMMILEFFNSGDENEFGRCVCDLAPLSDERSAELIRKVMTTAMERNGKDCEQALYLLTWLTRREEISSEALELGFDDLYRHMPDILLDVPDAEDMARSFVVEAKKAKVLREFWPEPLEP